MANFNYITEFSFCTNCCTHAWEIVTLHIQFHMPICFHIVKYFIITQTHQKHGLIRTRDDVSVAVLHAVLVFLSRIPGSRLTLEEALKRQKHTESTSVQQKPHQSSSTSGWSVKAAQTQNQPQLLLIHTITPSRHFHCNIVLCFPLKDLHILKWRIRDELLKSTAEVRVVI